MEAMAESHGRIALTVKKLVAHEEAARMGFIGLIINKTEVISMYDELHKERSMAAKKQRLAGRKSVTWLGTPFSTLSFRFLGEQPGTVEEAEEKLRAYAEVTKSQPKFISYLHSRYGVHVIGKGTSFKSYKRMYNTLEKQFLEKEKEWKKTR